MGQVGTVLDDVERAGGRIVFVQDGLDTAQPQSRLVLALLSEVARSESANIGFRVASAKAHLKGLGNWVGGPAPYGLRPDKTGHLEHDPATADTAREIAERMLAGETLARVARDLNDRGVPSPRGVAWTATSIGQLVRSPSFAGLLPEVRKRSSQRPGRLIVPYRDPETGETVVVGDGIVTPSEQFRIMQQLESRVRLRPDGTPVGQWAQSRHLLTGLVRCDACKARMSVNGLSYQCQSGRTGSVCPAPSSARVVPVDAAVFEAWAAKLASIEPGDELLDRVAERWVEQHDPDVIKQRATINEALDEATAALADLEDARYLRGEFVGPDAIKRWERLHTSLTNRVGGLRRNLADFPLPEADVSPLLDPVQVAEVWELAPVTERRDLLRLALDCVYVTRGTAGSRFDPDARLRFAWVDAGETPG